MSFGIDHRRRCSSSAYHGRTSRAQPADATIAQLESHRRFAQDFTGQARW